MTIVAGVAIVALAIGAIWYVVARGSEATITTEGDFYEAYDELGAKGETLDADRDAEWQDFHSWQVTGEEERRSWEEKEGE